MQKNFSCMDKAVLISIQPRWCQRTCSGWKTMELRKNKPALPLPFKCYIYCTKGNPKNPRELLEIHGSDGKIRKANGMVIGEFVCDSVLSHCEMANADIAEQQSLVRREDILAYAGEDEVYGWHISDLLVYDVPVPLSEFRRPCQNELYCEECALYSEHTGRCGNEALVIKRAPQSWCYVNNLHLRG